MSAGSPNWFKLFEQGRLPDVGRKYIPGLAQFDALVVILRENLCYKDRQFLDKLLDDKFKDMFKDDRDKIKEANLRKKEFEEDAKKELELELEAKKKEAEEAKKKAAEEAMRKAADEANQTNGGSGK